MQFLRERVGGGGSSVEEKVIAMRGHDFGDPSSLRIRKQRGYRRQKRICAIKQTGENLGTSIQLDYFRQQCTGRGGE